MKDNLNIGLAQINPCVGAIQDNASLLQKAIHEANEQHLDLLIFPELVISGYPPEDLLLKPHFVENCMEEVHALAGQLSSDLTVILGTPWLQEGQVYNAAAVLRKNQPPECYFKQLLPNYGVFDEKRLFHAGTETCIIDVKGARIAINICEDSWYTDSPAIQPFKDQRIDLLVNLSASPYYREKIETRMEIFGRTAREINTPIACTNLVGGQDELVFDGGSFLLDAQGQLITNAPQFQETLFSIDSTFPKDATINFLPDHEEIFQALVLGTRDYVQKNGFSKAIIALSGGIDSALVAAIAKEALGSENVYTITMPSQYSSDGTFNDAHRLAKNLGLKIDTLAIQPLFDSYLEALQPIFRDRPAGVAEENIQARIRGNIVMAISNKMGWLVLTTGNKSELAVGYCTLYGDMAGGFAVIKDVPKTEVFELCRWYNTHRGEEIIPQSIIDRPPSAELRPDQKDSDSLPPYDLLDDIIERYVEEDRSIEEIIETGIDEKTARRIARLIDLNEYKRRQAPPGIKITPKAFGKDRRMPITNHYRG